MLAVVYILYGIHSATVLDQDRSSSLPKKAMAVDSDQRAAASRVEMAAPAVATAY
jgi:hypothetical protein